MDLGTLEWKPLLFLSSVKGEETVIAPRPAVVNHNGL
ncbi:hypothetical protein JOE21_002800 [Desmospora profundinema]|uniref:Uncharacterized protein n=1 Tax=Desmospora profundinema TaxID=1571184 RepID=A0ABU1IPS3_9BACL|nr:hypothetical protein [Desmospora profundinema]